MTDNRQLTGILESLFLSPVLSDLTIKCGDTEHHAHRLLFYSLGNNWGAPITDVHSLDWSHLRPPIVLALLRWIYTAKITDELVETDLLSLMNAAGEFKLQPLVTLCEERLVTLTTVTNCFEMYTVAAGVKAHKLLAKAGLVIAEYWDTFTEEDFKDLDAPLACSLFLDVHSDPLHKIVTLGRVDVVDTFTKFHSSETTKWINRKGSKTEDFPLDIALAKRNWPVAEILLQSNANINAQDKQGWNRLQRSLIANDEETVLFLLKNNADIFYTTPVDDDTCLHLVVLSCSNDTGLDSLSSYHSKVTEILLEKGADANKKNSKGLTPLHFAIQEGALDVTYKLLENSDTDVNLTTNDGVYPLRLALDDPLYWRTLSDKLLEAGAKIDLIMGPDKQSLLQSVIEANLSHQAIYLCERLTKAQLNHVNSSGETALHLAAMKGLSGVVAKLIEEGANPNIETVAPSSRLTAMQGGSNVAYMGYKHTCLHYAILHGTKDTVEVLLEKQSSLVTKMDCNLRDSIGNTPLSLALNSRCAELVPKLIQAGADVNLFNSSGLTLLHKAILDGDRKNALLLLKNGAQPLRTEVENKHPLHMAIENYLGEVVDALCLRGVDMSVENEKGECALWASLKSQQFDIASILVRNGADTDAWGPGPDKLYRTLLHAAIEEDLKEAAIFLIQSGCDVNSPKRSAPEEGGDESGGTPLHLCSKYGFSNIAEALLDHGANINKKDRSGKTPLHLAILNKNEDVVDLFLSHPQVDVMERDYDGLTPFAMAVNTKCNKAASVIVEKFPNAAEEFDKKGLNLLHSSLEANQVESVLFLLSINVNVNSATRDQSRTPPLHIGAKGGNEVIVRSLILAGAMVNAVDAYKQTALHIAAAYGHAVVISALVSHEGDPDLPDSEGNNALHIACKEGHLAAVRVLLLESNVNTEIYNMKGRSPLHTLARYGKENAFAICDLIAETIPDYQFDRPDVDGNTALLVAYMKGNGNLCRSLVKAGACLGSMNNEGITIFNYHVATKQLLYSLLECLDKEPHWSEGDCCLECGTKFSLTMRKHHCRHCGRLLCRSCSDQDTAILKYKINKPVRVCAVCFSVLQGCTA